MIPECIQSMHLKQACEEIVSMREKIPANRSSTEHCLVYGDLHLAPKFVVSLAHRFVQGRMLSSTDFSGGPETNDFLVSRGFKVVSCHCGGLMTAQPQQRESQSPPVTHKVARLVCAGPPPKTEAKTRKWLEQAFLKRWPDQVRAWTAITPGGLLALPFPRGWQVQTGWDSTPQDFERLCQYSEVMIRRLFDIDLHSAARRRCDVMTIGIDLTSGDLDKPHVELVAVFDLRTEQIHWTGKSYPVKFQERALVHAISIGSHFWERDGERVLILGCHDLNVYSNRAKPKEGSPRFIRQHEMRAATKAFNPTMVLHHPHSTDAVGIWPVAWSGVKEHLWEGKLGNHSCASGIAWYRDNGEPRGSLERVLATTRRGDVIDIY